MKIEFRIVKNKLKATNNQELSKYIISEDGLKTGCEIAEWENKSVFDLLSHKKLYIVLPGEMVKKDTPAVVMAFAVRTANGIKMWSNKYLSIESGDVAFTTKEEADQLCKQMTDKQEQEKKQEQVDADDLLKELTELEEEAMETLIFIHLMKDLLKANK